MVTRLANTINKYDNSQLIEFIFPNTKNDDEDISKLFEDYFLNKVAPSSILKSGTKRNYRKSINHFQNYLANKNLCELSISSFKKKEAIDFRDYLIMENPIKGQKMKAYSGAGIIVKIKKIFNYLLPNIMTLINSTDKT